MIPAHLDPIVGERIRGVVVAHGRPEATPSSQLFLVFAGGRHFEFYVHEGMIYPGDGFYPGGLEAIHRVIAPGSRVVAYSLSRRR